LAAHAHGALIAGTRVTDDNPELSTDFISQHEDRLAEQETDMLRPADLVQLPKGQAFALFNSGKLYKPRLPLAGADPLLPQSMAIKCAAIVMLAILVFDCLYLMWPFPISKNICSSLDVPTA